MSSNQVDLLRELSVADRGTTRAALRMFACCVGAALLPFVVSPQTPAGAGCYAAAFFFCLVSLERAVTARSRELEIRRQIRQQQETLASGR